MKRRCHSPSYSGFYKYGARGIVVCDRWRESFEAFFADMGQRPSSDHSIERINNDGPYAPDNCRWATRHEQTRNTRRTRRITINGKTLCLNDWLAHYALSASAFFARVNRGMNDVDALVTPSRRRGGKKAA